MGTRSSRGLAGVSVLLALTCVLAGCGRKPEPTARETRSPAEDSALIAADRPERLVVPFAPPASGRLVVERVAPARASLDLAPPQAEPSEPPPAAEKNRAEDDAQLKPPIARGAPEVPRVGRAPAAGGSGKVTFDVRVSETGEVTDVELVETDADPLTVEAAKRAAWGLRYHPALLRGEPVAVWCRQVFEVERNR